MWVGFVSKQNSLVKTTRNSWDDQTLEEARHKVIVLGEPINKVAQELGIPRTTLQKKLANNEAKSEGNFYSIFRP